MLSTATMRQTTTHRLQTLMSYDNPIPLFSDTELHELIVFAEKASDGERLPELAEDLLYELQQKTNCRTFSELLDVFEDEALYRKDLAKTMNPRYRFDSIVDLLLAVLIVLVLAAMYYWYSA